MEVRGDWSFFQSVFSFPGWRNKGGCCWKCPAQLADIADASSAAPWRQTRYSHWDVLQIMANKKGISPLFSCPFLTVSCFRIDWLHCCDLGVAADFVGNVLYAVSKEMPGGNSNERCKQMFREIVTWYKANGVQDRLQKLTVTMIQKSSTAPPKLRAKAAEARALVPFALYAAQRWLSADGPVHAAIRQAAAALVECYNHLTPEVYDPAELRVASRTFCLQYAALRQFHEGTCFWRIKPKFHLFQELCEMTRSCPSASWTYRDEDFGGSLVRFFPFLYNHSTLLPNHAVYFWVDTVSVTH